MSIYTMDRPLLDATAQQEVQELTLCFGAFRLCPVRRELLKHGQPVALGSRALDLLIVLATRAGELLEKDALIAYAWPNVVVEECNLRAQIVALRRLLHEDGNDYIATVPGRGYRFVALPALSPAQPLVEVEHAQIRRACAPVVVNQAIGRDEEIAHLCNQVRTQWATTIVGPGGIGKSTVALEVAQRVSAGGKQNVIFVDLCDAGNFDEAQAAIVRAVDGTQEHPPSWSQALALLRRRPALLLLDNCEHLATVVATLLEDVRMHARCCHVLVTSRWPLNVRGESLLRVGPLALPSSASVELPDLMRFPAVQLFIQRANANGSNFVPQQDTAAALNQLCHCLNGIPLEIDIAAARVGRFGVGPLLNMLQGHYRLQMAGRRTARERHRSIGKVLDGAYLLLTPSEQALLRWASTFTGPFTLNAIAALVRDDPLLDGYDLNEVLGHLADKSMLLVDSSTSVRYQLLNSTRLYAAGKLEQAGGTQQAVARHMAYALAVIRDSAVHKGKIAKSWRLALGAEGDAVRSALAQVCAAKREQSPTLELKLAALGLTPDLQRKVFGVEDSGHSVLAEWVNNV